MTNLNITRKEFERAILLLKKKDIEEEEFLRIKDEYSKAMNHYDASKSNLLSLGLVDSQNRYQELHNRISLESKYV